MLARHASRTLFASSSGPINRCSLGSGSLTLPAASTLHFPQLPIPPQVISTAQPAASAALASFVPTGTRISTPSGSNLTLANLVAADFSWLSKLSPRYLLPQSNDAARAAS
jgi:hypothetical protein